MVIIDLKEKGEFLPIFGVASSNDEPRPRKGKKKRWMGWLL